MPSLPLSKVVKEELPDNVNRRIFVFERASQFELLSRNPETFMWMSPLPQDLLERYQLVEKICAENTRVYRDILVYLSKDHLTELDRQFIAALSETKQKYL